MTEFAPASIEKEGPFGNIFSRNMHFPEVGSQHHGHCHNYDHVTFITSGAVNVVAFKVDMATQKPIPGTEIDRNFKAPAMINIKKEMWHRFTALEPGTFAKCVFALRDFNGDVTEEWDGNLEPYL